MCQVHLQFPEPAGIQAWHCWLRRARQGAGWACSASAQAEFVCLGTKPWSSWLRAGWWFALSGCRSGPHVLHKARCCWGSVSVDAQSWRSWRSSRDCAGPRTECEVWFKLSWLRSGGSSAVGLGVLWLGSPPALFLYMGTALASAACQVRILGVTWCIRRGDAVSK